MHSGYREPGPAVSGPPMLETVAVSLSKGLLPGGQRLGVGEDVDQHLHLARSEGISSAGWPLRIMCSACHGSDLATLPKGGMVLNFWPPVE